MIKTRDLFGKCTVLVVVLCLVVLLFSDRWVPLGNFFWSDLNLYGIVAFVWALFSLLYTFLAYKSQEQTERNTSNVPIKDQKEKFRDLTRHEYRNLVVVLSTAVKYFGKSNTADGIRISYPSESHILKLQAAPEDFVLDINPEMAAAVSEMRLLLRNYNIEINVACKHLAKQTINHEAITSDYDNLIFKPLFLVRKACEMEAKLSKDGKSTEEMLFKMLIKRSIGIIVAEHLKKLPDSLPTLIARLTNDGMPDYYSGILEMDNGLSIESADQTNALHRSFSKLFKDVLDNGTLLLKMDYNADNNIKENIDSILTELDSAMPKLLKWIAAYKDTLESIKSGKELDFVQFFPLMLKLDIAAELNKIGMVKF